MVADRHRDLQRQAFQLRLFSKHVEVVVFRYSRHQAATTLEAQPRYGNVASSRLWILRDDDAGRYVRPSLFGEPVGNRKQLRNIDGRVMDNLLHRRLLDKPWRDWRFQRSQAGGVEFSGLEVQRIFET